MLKYTLADDVDSSPVYAYCPAMNIPATSLMPFRPSEDLGVGLRLSISPISEQPAAEEAENNHCQEIDEGLSTSSPEVKHQICLFPYSRRAHGPEELHL
jgi:hypothetical protein